MSYGGDSGSGYAQGYKDYEGDGWYGGSQGYGSSSSSSGTEPCTLSDGSKISLKGTYQIASSKAVPTDDIVVCGKLVTTSGNKVVHTTECQEVDLCNYIDW